MKSKLKLNSLLFPSLALIFIGISLFTIVDNYPINFFKLRGIDYFMIILFIITLIWLIRFEIYRKLIFLKLYENQFSIKNDLQQNNTYNFNNLLKYETQIVKISFGIYEETIIFTNDNQEFFLSEFFLENYIEIKNSLIKNLKDKGGPRKYN